MRRVLSMRGQVSNKPKWNLTFIGGRADERSSAGCEAGQ